MNIDQIASAVQNNVSSGLRGTNDFNYSIEQIKDEVKLERNKLLKEYSLRGVLPSKDLRQKITCIKTDCKDLAKCCEGGSIKPLLHFELPRISTIYGSQSIGFIGSSDMAIQFKVYTDKSFTYAKYSRFGSKDPIVYIDLSTNENGMLDAFIFNNSKIKQVTVELIPNDPEDLMIYDCCKEIPFDPTNFLTADIINRLTEKYVRYYRQLNIPPQPNTQS